MSNVSLRYPRLPRRGDDGRLRLQRTYGTGYYCTRNFAVWRDSDRQWRCELNGGLHPLHIKEDIVVAFNESELCHARFQYRREAVEALSALVASMGGEL